MAEKIVIIGSGPAGWTAALYASRANLEPLVFEGAITEANRLKGTLPLGQLALTTEVENYPGFPEGVMGPDLMEKFRAQAKRFGTRVITDDIASVDFARHPFRLTPREQPPVEALSVIIATGAGELPGTGIGGAIQEPRRVGLCCVQRGAGTVSQPAAGRGRRRRFGCGRRDILDQVREQGLCGLPS